MGGGIYSTAPMELKDCTIRDNTALGSGGGIYNGNTGNTILDQTIVAGNTSGYRGGGIYTNARLTLRNDTYIRSNQITNGDALNAAGVYISNKTLTVGDETRNTLDPTTVKDNFTAGGQPSDLRLWWDDGTQQNNSSVYQ